MNAPAQPINTGALEAFVGYNARRASLVVMGALDVPLAPLNLTPVTFSLLSLVADNPGITARQLCGSLGILPPNIVALLAGLVERGLITRLPHTSDKRAQSLHPTDAGAALRRQAQAVVQGSDNSSTAALSSAERTVLLTLLQKIYKTRDNTQNVGEMVA